MSYSRQIESGFIQIISHARKIRIVSFGISLLVSLAGSAVVAKEPSAMKPGQAFRDCPECPEMIVIPAGQFMMGMSPEESKRDQEEERLFSRVMNDYAAMRLPQHLVILGKAFAIGKHPVTRGEFAIFVAETGFSNNQPCTVRVNLKYFPSSTATWQHPGFEQSDNDPVVCVSYQDAQAYTAWLDTKVSGGGLNASSGPYRLPSEAEWEYAARAGTQTVRWWGDEIGHSRAVCHGCFSAWDNQQPSPVGYFGHNQFGLTDVLGNIWQLTSDCWNKNYEHAPEDGSSWLTGACAESVMRGGAWVSDISGVTSASRSYTGRFSKSNTVGFRVAKTL